MLLHLPASTARGARLVFATGIAQSPRMLSCLRTGVIATVATLACSAQDALSPTQRIELFDGRSLAGWTFVSRDSSIDAASIWSVKDGVIQCAGKPNGYARAPGVFRDYVLQIEWRWPAAPGGNSG